MTGAALQSIFGLATTDAAFTTVSTTGARGAPAGDGLPRFERGRGLGPGARRRRPLAERASPAPQRGRVTGRARSAAGSITATGLTPGRYRIVAGSLTGPVVTVS